MKSVKLYRIQARDGSEYYGFFPADHPCNVDTSDFDDNGKEYWLPDGYVLGKIHGFVGDFIFKGNVLCDILVSEKSGLPMLANDFHHEMPIMLLAE